MKIKIFFQADCFQYHMVVETTDGEYKTIFINPTRRIVENDLRPLPQWNPVGRNGREAEPYMYEMYGLEK